MYHSHSQLGRTRVNKIREGIKRGKQPIQNKKKNLKSIDKLYILQKDLFLSGMNFSEYENYIQDKINNDMFHYKNISEKQVDELKKRYKSLIKKEQDEYFQIGEEKRVNRKQRKLFREKKRKLIHERKSELISKLFKLFSNGNFSGVIRNTSHLSTNSDDWLKTKSFIFSGEKNNGLGNNNEWSNIYNKLTSQNSALLFDLHSISTLNDYVYNQ